MALRRYTVGAHDLRADVVQITAAMGVILSNFS